MPHCRSRRHDDAGPRDVHAVPTPSGDPPRRGLTDRQLEVLGHVARGRTNRQVGELLGISERTVRNHLRTIGQRLSTTDRTHSVVLAIGHGWIAVPLEPEHGMVIAPPRPAESAS
jgi:DNA-binding NarL/FixJ family response regulator